MADNDDVNVDLFFTVKTMSISDAGPRTTMGVRLCESWKTAYPMMDTVSLKDFVLFWFGEVVEGDVVHRFFS